MHLRRALLLFAIVLGLAAVAASISRPRNASDSSDPLRTPAPTTELEPPAKAAPEPAGTEPPVELTFFAGDPHPQRIRAGQAASVSVEVEEAGQVEIADLGMSAVAEPQTPARFEVFTRATGRHRITFVPAAAEDQPVRIGTLVVAKAL